VVEVPKVSPMRRIAILLTAAFAAVAPLGCEWLNRNKGPQDIGKNTPNDGRLEERPAKDFVAYLNRQASYVSTVRYDDVSLKATIPGQSFIPTLRSGMLVCQKPRNFRMQAGLAIGGDQIDIGSNPQELWMFVKQPKPQFLFCSHTDFPKLQDDLPVPFEPDWVLLALGMTPYDPNKPYIIEKDDRTRTYKLICDDTTSTGQRVRRITEFAGNTSDGTTPQIRRHIIQQPDRNGWTTVTVAEIQKVQTMESGVDPSTRQKFYVQVPTQILLEWPLQKVKMDLTLGRIKLNQTEETTLFSKPNRIDNTSPVNLADLRYQR
jgi:hypothetical protein